MANRPAQKILIWLPSPLGDAILSTPALSAIRTYSAGSHIVFLAESTVKAFLWPCPFCDTWMEKSKCFLTLCKQLRYEKFDAAVLFKNSFGSALSVFLAGIPERIGYARDGRSLLLTRKIAPQKANGRFKPISAMDYYLDIARTVGAQIKQSKLHVGIEPEDRDELDRVIPELKTKTGPLVILVVGGAFGPSKLWPAERFAALSDRLYEMYKTTAVVSVAPTQQEKIIAQRVCKSARFPLLSLSDRPLKPGPLKALFEKADLVITNDTGPRHIAAALDRKLITLFGPNNPAWTQTGYEHEVQIVGQAPCAPCDKPKCFKQEHYCMHSISIEQVFAAARTMLETKLND